MAWVDAFFAGTISVKIVKLTFKMPPKYQFENVICYIYFLTLLTNEGIYANSAAAGQTSSISLVAAIFPIVECNKNN